MQTDCQPAMQLRPLMLGVERLLWSVHAADFRGLRVYFPKAALMNESQTAIYGQERTLAYTYSHGSYQYCLLISFKRSITF